MSHKKANGMGGGGSSPSRETSREGGGVGRRAFQVEGLAMQRLRGEREAQGFVGGGLSQVAGGLSCWVQVNRRMRGEDWTVRSLDG